MTNEKNNHPSRLSAEERNEMKDTFMAYMEERPAHSPAPRRVLSPYFPHLVRVPAFALAAFLFVLTGSAYAAESSLPNDFLYPVKTNIIEPMFIEAPAFTKEAEARANTKLVARRLEEVGELMDKEELSSETATYLSARIDAHAAEVSNYITEAVAAGDLSNALEVSTDLETTLEAHSDVLESVAEEHGVISDTVQELIEGIEEDAATTATSGELIEDGTIAGSSVETQDYIEDSRKEVEETLSKLRASISNLHESGDEDLVEKAQVLLIEAETNQAESASALSIGDTGGAVENIRDSLQAAKRAEILIDSYEELEEGEAN